MKAWIKKIAEIFLNMWAPFRKIVDGVKIKGLRQFIKENISVKNESNIKIAQAIALGIFIGIVPIWGWQTVTTLALAHFFRLNKMLALLASNISIFPATPAIIFLSYKLGESITGLFISIGKINVAALSLIQYIIGSICLAISASVVIGSLLYLFLFFFRKEKNKTELEN